MIPIEHCLLAYECNTYEEFQKRFLEKYKDSINPMKLAKYVYNCWYRKEAMRGRVEKHLKAQHTVMIPAQIKKPALATTFKPDDDLQVKIYNQLLYIGQLLKEQNELFNKLASQKEGP